MHNLHEPEIKKQCAHHQLHHHCMLPMGIIEYASHSMGINHHPEHIASLGNLRRHWGHHHENQLDFAMMSPPVSRIA
jgi:hypothetical protein